ncbi:hypothetical protein [Tenacibaculum ovolyticum]|uniref:hypothetical protein n=1 Tax=Tenacibaculum ovolyticum TaxID=104270 RepID=UPI0007ED6492|nr:hypothetical protein [Tenacibaculum ovolyticum]
MAKTSGLNAIGAFAQQNETLTKKSMTSISGGVNGQYNRPIDVKYSTSASGGGDTDCVDYYSDGGTRVYY